MTYITLLDLYQDLYQIDQTLSFPQKSERAWLANLRLFALAEAASSCLLLSCRSTTMINMYVPMRITNGNVKGQWVLGLSPSCECNSMRDLPQATSQTTPAYKLRTCAEASDLSDARPPDPGSTSLGNLLLSM